MSKIKAKNKTHSYIRAKERTNLSKRETERLMKEASRSGIAAGNMTPGPLKDYLETKGRYKRVKYYKGYIFVFSKNSTACITMYPADEEVLKQEEEYQNEQTNIRKI